MKKLFLILLVVILISSFFIFDIDKMLTLEGIKNIPAQIASWYDNDPWQVVAIYFILYVLVTGLSLPGAVFMTLAGGAIFGLFWGTVIISFASTIGATGAFLVARYLLKDVMEARFTEKLQAINMGIEREGAFYLFTLRLVPIFPFFLINILMGLTRIRTITYYWVSQLGMLAGTIVYVNAGTQLAQLETVSGILSPPLLLSFTLLGIFPLLAKKLINAIKKQRVYAQWTKPKRFDRNLVVIGAGAAGLVSAYIAAAVKAKVTLVETHKMGGDCLNYGCVPSKALIKSAKLAEQIRHAENYGLEYKEALKIQGLSFKTVMQRIQKVIAAIAPHDSIERYTQMGVEVIEGYAKILTPWEVEIQQTDGTQQKLTTQSIIIASGAAPFIPAIPGLDSIAYLSSDTLWEHFAQRDSMPERLVILGGGPIGCELAQSFARLGINVTLVQRQKRLMVREDEDVSEVVKKALEESAVTVLTEHVAVRCEHKDTEKSLIVSYQGTEKQIFFDELICAVGRKARLSGYGLEDLGIPVERTVITNEYLEVLYPNIYAAGDVAGPYQFTHVAAHQAWYAAVNALFGHWKKFKVDYTVIPWVTFVDPELARVGMNEQQAKEQDIAYEISYYGIDDLDRAITESEAKGFIKVLTVPGKDRILGVTIVGTHAGEMLAEFVLAMRHGLGLNKILGTIHAYPTWMEANKYVAGVWKRQHTPKKLLIGLQKYHTWRRG